MVIKLFISFLRRHFYILLLILLTVGAVVVFIFTCGRYASFYNISFWQNSVSNFISTFLGLLFGIPIALWLNSVQQDIVEKNENLKLQNEEKKRKRKILDSLKTELSSTLELFKSYPGFKIITEDAFDEVYFTATASCVEVWKSFSDGGSCSG